MTDKSLVVGLDCCDPDLIRRWSVQYNLEAFKTMIEQGFMCNLQSTIPPVTIPAWISMFSGKDPDKLNAFGLLKLEKDYTLHPYSSHQWRGNMVWDFAGMQKKTTGIVLLPFYYPSYPVDGFMISDPASSKNWAYPPELESELDPPAQHHCVTFKGYKALFEREKEIVLKMLDRSVDLLIVGTRFLDNVVHMNSPSTLKKAYTLVDAFLSWIIDVCNDQKWNLLVVSDHGCKKIDTLFNVNALLERSGVLTHRDYPELQMRLQDLLLEYMPGKLMGIMNKMRMKSHAPAQRTDSRDLILPNVVFSETRAFAHDCGGTSSYGGIWLNTKNVFDNGFLPVEDTEKLATSVVEMMCKLNVVTSVAKMKDLYPEGSGTTFPDLIFQLRNNVIPFFGPSRKLFFSKKMYAHRRTGVLLGSGPDFSRNSPKNARVKDIMPTLMHLLGCEIPSDIDGKVLDIFKPGSDPHTRKISYYDAKESKRIRKAVDEQVRNPRTRC